MSAPAAFSGDYVDLRFVKTRSVCQVVIEIDISLATSFVAAFGTPMPGTGVPVALAKLKLESSSTVEPRTVNAAVAGSNPASLATPKERRSWFALSYAEQAGIRCNEESFWKFINDRERAIIVGSQGDAAGYIREFCGVRSRADIKSGTTAANNWRKLDGDYESWLRR